MAADSAPLLPKDRRGLHGYPLSSVWKTFGNLVISVVGAGVLGLPYTYKVTGWLAGTIVLAIIAAAVFYAMLLLVASRKRIERDQRNDQVETYSDLGYHVFGNGGKTVVDALVLLSQGGFCVAYLIFIGENLATVFTESVTPSNSSLQAALFSGINWRTKAVYIWIIFPLQVALASVRSLTTLAPFSIFADVVNALAILVVLKADVKEIAFGDATVNAFNGFHTLPFAIGVAIYAFEGFSLVLPLESGMHDRKKFPKVLGAALAVVTAVYIIFGLFGYLAFGEHTADIITLNLGHGIETLVVKIFLSIALFFTFPVMMYPVYEVVERRSTEGRPTIIVRACIVLFVVWLAIAVPKFGVFLALVGSSVCCFLSFVLPAIFHLHVFGKDLSWLQLGADYIFIIFGIGFGIGGTISSALDLISK